MTSVILLFDTQPNGAVRVAVCANAAMHPTSPGTGARLLPSEGQAVCAADSGPLLYGPRTDETGAIETAPALQARVIGELQGFVAQYEAQQVVSASDLVGTNVAEAGQIVLRPAPLPPTPGGLGA